MMRLECAVLLLVAVAGAVADTPVDCRFSDIVGEWHFLETERTGAPGLACDKLGDVVHHKTVTLRFPNTAEDEVGNIGTWTMVYDQGFEVRVAGRSYFAFSYYTQDGKNVSSYCDRTFTGWARDLTVRNWSCFKGIKASATNDTDTPSRFRMLKPRHLLESQPYQQDHRFVDTINRHQQSWTATTYPQFEGMSLADLFRMRGGQTVHKSQKSLGLRQSSLDTRLRASMLPDSWDWRNVSDVTYVRPVKNQGNCGSCYAFASIATIESQLMLHSDGKEDIDLSAEDIVGCSKLSQGCDGGFPYLIAGRYGQDMGLVSERCVPYDISPTCDHKRDSCRHVYTTDYKYVGGYFGACNEDEMMLALVKEGPLAVGIEVKDDFMHYKSGVYHHTGISDAFNPLEETNHAVLLVGYGATDAGEKYWIVQNSWGTGWGMDGYVLIRRGTDEIAIESMAVQATAYP